MAPRAAFIAAVLAAAAPLALAACPNACSGHGTCGEFDSCSCYTNWEGADCSMRNCPHQYSWITTSKGDLNFDGSTYGSTIYDTNNYIANSGYQTLTTQKNPGGDWEKWPGKFNLLSKDEGHFYMECSNRGICDRKTGVCKCFDGYAGDACRRAACPANCNGHGTCKSVDDQKGATTYNLWDGSKSRNCVCDSGYTGASCATRVCPRGDDPLTTGQHNEVQWVDIYSDRVSDADQAAFSGTVTLTYTDHDGNQWTTDTVTVAPYAGVATTMDDDIKTVLEALPGSPITDVTVTEGWCDTPLDGTFSVASDVVSAGTAFSTTQTLTTGDILRFPAANPTIKVTMTSATAASSDLAGTGASLTDATDTYVRELAHWNCVRFKITFNSVSGDVPDLVVNTAGLTLARVTGTGAASAGTIGTTITDTLDLGVGTIAELKAPATVSVACGANCAISGTTLALGDNSGTVAEAKFRPDEVISVTCDNVNIGKYTVSASSQDTITTVETLTACSSTNNIVATLESYIVEVNTNLVGYLDVGSELNIDTFASRPYSVSAVKWAVNTNAAAGRAGRIFLDRAYVGDDTAGAETATDGSTNVVQWYGKGTTESSECGDRGVCNSESGACKCFKGYTGQSCSTQNAIAAS